MSEDKIIHFIVDVNKPHDAALCGVRWKMGSDAKKYVTCPECKRLLEVKNDPK